MYYATTAPNVQYHIIHKNLLKVHYIMDFTMVAHSILQGDTPTNCLCSILLYAFDSVCPAVAMILFGGGILKLLLKMIVDNILLNCCALCNCILYLHAYTHHSLSSSPIAFLCSSKLVQSLTTSCLLPVGSCHSKRKFL